MVTGVGTVIADDCSLTVREAELGLPPESAVLAGARQPLRVVLDCGNGIGGVCGPDVLRALGVQ